MQNKPNSQKAQINANSVYTRNHNNFIPLAGQKNKPNSNPIKPNLQKAKMNINSFITKDYRKKDDFEVRINKPNFFKRPKMNVNLYNIEDYENKTTLRPQKNKPNSKPIVERMKVNPHSQSAKAGGKMRKERLTIIAVKSYGRAFAAGPRP